MVLSLRLPAKGCSVARVVLGLSRARPGPVDCFEEHSDRPWHLAERATQVVKLLLTMRVGRNGGLSRVVILDAIARRLHLGGHEQFFKNIACHFPSE
jgi:hypothetical protein